RKLDGVDALALLLEVEQTSSLDPLIPRIVWQNLLPLIEQRRNDLARWLTDRKGKAPGLSLLIPRTIERLLDSSASDAVVVAKLLFACSNQDSTVESLDVLLERFREHSLPRPFEDALRAELNTVLKSKLTPLGDPAGYLVTVAQAYCGDQQ